MHFAQRRSSWEFTARKHVQFWLAYLRLQVLEYCCAHQYSVCTSQAFRQGTTKAWLQVEQYQSTAASICLRLYLGLPIPHELCTPSAIRAVYHHVWHITDPDPDWVVREFGQAAHTSIFNPQFVPQLRQAITAKQQQQAQKWNRSRSLSAPAAVPEWQQKDRP